MSEQTVRNDIDELIVRYLSGEIDKPSFERLKQWADESNEYRQYLRMSLETGFSAGAAGDPAHFSSARGYAVFRQRVADYKQEMNACRTHLPWKTIGWVAAVVLAVLLPLAGFWQGQRMINSRFASVKMETAMGSRTQLYLPDGTLVWLNAGSCLTYPQDFGINNRRVSLQGEAYFDVKRNETLPFEINTREIDLKVLGTRFTFSNYPDDDFITVDLVKGKVSLNDHLLHREMYLEPNERMTYNKRTGEMNKTQIMAENAGAWMKEELFFDEQPLSEIARKLSRAYNVKIEVADYLKQKSFYGSFNIARNTVDDVLRAISATNRMKYRYRNGKYILY